MEVTKKHLQRANIYKALSLLYSQPSTELAEALGYLREALQYGHKALVSNAGQMEAEINKDILQELQVDHAKLFVGPASLLAPPYGSVYLEDGNRVMGETTLDVLARYATAGLKVDSDKIKEPADHVVIELEFMYYLICRYLETGDNCYLDWQSSFLSDHLALWLEEFTANVQNGASTAFYKSLALITREFIRDELEQEAISMC